MGEKPAAYGRTVWKIRTMALDLASLDVFVRVADPRSFTRAAQQLGMPKARASAHVQRLEAALGTHLLQRSTRVVRTTAEGEQLLERAPSSWRRRRSPRSSSRSARCVGACGSSCPGRLVEILPDLGARPVPSSLLHTHGRSPPRRVQAVMAWLAELPSSRVGELTPR